MKEITERDIINTLLKLAQKSRKIDPDNEYWQNKINEFEDLLKKSDQEIEEYFKEFNKNQRNSK